MCDLFKPIQKKGISALDGIPGLDEKIEICCPACGFDDYYFIKRVQPYPSPISREIFNLWGCSRCGTQFAVIIDIKIYDKQTECFI